MAVTINNVYPWGRFFEEYRRMFRLSDQDLSLKIVGCADGPANFNAEMNRRGQRVVSCDPLYRFPADDIRRRIAATFKKMLADAAAMTEAYKWDVIRSRRS